MDDAHEIDVHHALEHRRIGLAKRRGFRGAGIGDEDIDRLARGGLRDCGVHGGLVGDIGNHGMVGNAGRDQIIQRPAVAAEHGDGGPGLHERRRDLPADPARSPGDERMRRTRQSRHAKASPREFLSAGTAYILNFKLLQTG